MQHRTAAGIRRFPIDLGKSIAIKTTVDGFTYLGPTQFHDYFVADLPVEPAASSLERRMPYERGATQWKSQESVLRSMSPNQKGIMRTHLRKTNRSDRGNILMFDKGVGPGKSLISSNGSWFLKHAAELQS